MFTVVGDHLDHQCSLMVGDHLDHQCSLWSVMFGPSMFTVVGDHLDHNVHIDGPNIGDVWTINEHCGR